VTAPLAKVLIRLAFRLHYHEALLQSTLCHLRRRKGWR
jgi:hypothetical protein